MVEPSQDYKKQTDKQDRTKLKMEELQMIFEVDENDAATATKTLQMHDMSPPT